MMSAPALPPFEVSCTKEDRSARLALRGELDMSSAPVLARELARAARRRPDRIVLDLAELSFMDVTGLRAILDVARRVRRYGGAVVIENPQPHILRLLELTAIDQTLEVTGRPLAPVRT
jgi:anti-anti-sigma factor